MTVAFANSDGGEFVVGIAGVDEEVVADNRWKGASKIEDFNGHLRALSEIKPSAPTDFTIFDAPGKPGLVLLVRIEKSSEVHQTSDGTVFIRKGAQSLPLKDQQQILSQVRDSLRRIRRLCGPRSWGVKAWALLSSDHQTQTGS
jgi:ATP-dependent DNA helicase RecG